MFYSLYMLYYKNYMIWRRWNPVVMKWGPNSVVAAIARFFAILGNKLCKITKIFGELDHIKS